jgi:flavin reductase (DIM6/NTAB) family NADH-FMN oxidoreductase RutF
MLQTAEGIAPERFRQVMSRFATGVSVVTYQADDGPKGMTANAFLSVSLDPPLVLVSVRKRARVLRHIATGDLFGVNFLASDQAGASDHFGGRGDGDLAVEFHDDLGAPLLKGCLGWVVARVVDLHPAGDHRLMIGRVEALEDRPASPLVYYQGRYLGELDAKEGFGPTV